MSPRQPQTVLVLGGIRSGKSEFAESLVGAAETVRYVATGQAGDEADSRNADSRDADADGAAWAARIAAHRDRRPAHWLTEEIGKTPAELAALIAAAPAGDTLLVDDIGGWLAALLSSDPPDGADAAAKALAAAVADADARLVLVSPEVGLSVIPATAVGRAFADACGQANRALADACDGVVLVVAGQPTWLKHRAGRLPDSVVIAPAMTVAAPPAVAVTDFDRDGLDLDSLDRDASVTTGMTLPLPDHEATTAAIEHIASLPVLGGGLGAIGAAVTFLAGARGSATPAPFRSVRIMHVYGGYDGGIAAGDTTADWAARLAAIRDGSAPLSRLAAPVAATIEMIDAGDALRYEDGNAATSDDIDAALARGWQAANAAADRGDDLIVLAAGGPGIDAAASAVIASLTTAEVPSLLGRVWREGGRIDDDAWMARCVVARDAVRRLRTVPGATADGPTALGALGGPAIATATGVLLGAAQRRTPVMIDGPAGAAAALAAREYAIQSRLWCLLVDDGHHPAVRVAADMLSLEPLVDLRIGLGEGCTALALLPLIQSALLISSSVISSAA